MSRKTTVVVMPNLSRGTQTTKDQNAMSFYVWADHVKFDPRVMSVASVMAQSWPTTDTMAALRAIAQYSNSFLESSTAMRVERMLWWRVSGWDD